VVAALRRLLVLLVAPAAVVGAVSALLGLAAGSSLGRALSVGFYLVGALLIVLGFFAGSRGPMRPRTTDDEGPIAGMFGVGRVLRGVRRATSDERQDALATAALFLGVGVWLILLGVLADTSARVV
jgi:hypothetical protein